MKKNHPTGKNDVPKKNGKCASFGVCGACRYLDLPYEQQLRRKEEHVRSLIGRYGPVRPITGMEDPLYYRNKVHAVFGSGKGGKLICGTYREGTHRIVSNEGCLLEDRRASGIIRDIRALAQDFGIPAYNEDTGYGILRHVLVRVGHETGQILVVLVTGSGTFPSRRNFVKALLQLHPEITTIVENRNGRRTSMVLGEQETVLWGRGFIEDILCGCKFRISPRSFYQVNSVQTELLYRKAIELAAFTGTETVIDAYCGIGTIGMACAPHVRQVIGVESNRDAVRDAISNAKENRISNIRFVQGDAGAFLQGMAERGEQANVLLMDPPRTGSTPQFLHAALKMRPERIVYISCEPGTLARDLKTLTAGGYRMTESWPFDQFVFTEHVECVCLLGRRKPDDTIKVSVNMDDYYQIRDAEEAEKNPS